MTDSEKSTPLPIVRTDKDQIAWLTLNRPKRANALDQATIALLGAELDDIATDKQVRVVVIDGAGSAFSAGHDLKEMLELEPESGTKAAFDACANTMLKIQNLPQPVIAKVHGIATAAGCQLVAACDLAIAATSARFAMSGINLGLFCATPLVQVSRNIGKSAALEMAFTGKFINAVEAQTHGLISRAVGDEVLDVEVENLALEIASKSPSAITRGKQLYYQQRNLSIEDAYALAAGNMADNLNESETRDGIKAFVNKKPPPTWRNRK